ncbi:uncharacterized protein LOC144267673 isoform X2 [Eretmochelys imbricata]
MEEAPLDELLLLALSLLCQETGRASVRRWWTVQRRFLCHRRFLTNFLMDLQEEEEEEEAEEEEYPDIMDSQWQILLSIIGITADVPCVDRCFWCRVTSTDWWDHIVMQTWDDQHWVQYFHMKKATFLELCEQLTPILQRKETHMRSPLPVQKRVAITVWKLATPDCYRSVANQFGIGKSTVGKVVAEVTEAIRRVVYPQVAGIKDIPEIKITLEVFTDPLGCQCHQCCPHYCGLLCSSQPL